MENRLTAHVPRFLQPIGIALLLAGVAPGLSAQEMTPEEIHDRISRVIAERAPRALPRGDTTVTWTRGPILYHTVRARGNVVRSGFLRNDSVLGLASVSWRDGAPISFDVSWRQRDSILFSLAGTRRGSVLRLRGARSDSILIPALPWGVADYGSEEHLVPLLRRLGPRPEPWTLAVYRPFARKWDTLQVRLGSGPEGSLTVREMLRPDSATWIISGTGELLRLLRNGGSVERRPLENTRLYPLYWRLRAATADHQ
jgi:hypothetical protein